MDITFSRHAKRRLKLYKLNEKDVADAIEVYLTKARVLEKASFVDDRFRKKFGFPLKVVLKREKGVVVVITAYPLKKGKES